MRSSETETNVSETNGSQNNTRKQSEIFSTRASAHTHRTAPRTHRSAASTARISKPLVTLATALLIATLIVSSAWIFTDTGAFAAGTTTVTASSLTNNNIGKHPLHALLSWDATGENLQNGGRFNWGAAVTGDYVDVDSSTGKVTSGDSSDEITPKFIKTAVNSTLKDDGGDTILEQSPIFTYKRETKKVNGVEYSIYVDTNGNAVYFDSIAQDIALKYGFREGKELVFNINDEGTAARVWADAVLFTQHIGPAENIPFVSNLDYDRYRYTGLIPDTTMYAFEEGDYIFRTQLTPEEVEAGSVVYNEAADAYGVWENYDASKNGNADYLQNEGGTVQRFAHFFVNDNGSYYYDQVLKTMVRDTTSDTDNVEQYGGHKVKYSYYVPNFDGETGLTKPEAEGGTLNVHGPVYRGNYFIENGRYEGWGTTGAYGGAKLMGQYITVRLNCDWVAKEIETSIYTVKGKTTSFDYVYTNEKKGDANYEYYSYNTQYVTDKNNPTTTTLNSEGEKTKYFTEYKSDGYTVYYDASSIPFATGHTPFTPYNELCAFSNGRINVPVGSYIVLDLNGHTIDRNLDENYDKNAADSAYQYFGSVFSVNEFARLEVYDGTAFENASDTHISGTNKDKPESNYGVGGGLTTDQVGTITGGYVTHQFTKDGGNGRAVHEGNELEDIGDSNFKTQLTKLKLKTGDEVHTDFASTIADDNQAKGAAIHLFSHSDFVLHSGTISGNNAASQYGGAVYLLTNSSMTMFDGYVINNQSYRIGGGIYLADASASVLTMYNGVVGYNYGGAGELTIDKSNDLREDVLRQFRTIENYGGGIALRTKAYCNLYGGELVGNYSYGPGAGMYIQSTAVGTLAGVTIKGNHTYGSPGGQGGSFAPFGGGGGIFVGGTGARIGFRGALQIVENYRDNTVNDYQGKNLDSPTDGENIAGSTTGTHKTITDIEYTSTEGKNTRADNLYLPMREMTKDTTPTNPNTNTMNQVGEKTDGAKASTNYDKRWDSNASIVISGPLIEKGIVANIGITMQAATSYFNADDNTDKKLNEDGTTESSENIKLVFTQHYTKNGDSQHNDIDAHYFFTSDNPDYSIEMVDGEAKLHKATPTETQLTWVVEGKGIDADTKADAQGAPVLSDLRVIVKPDGELEFYYKNSNRTAEGDFKDKLAKVTATTEIESSEVTLSTGAKTKQLLDILKNSFVATSGSLDFEYSMLNVTKVAVYSGNTLAFDANNAITSTALATWSVTGNGDSFGINSTFYTSNFRFKLGEEDLEFKNDTEDTAKEKVPDDSRMFKAIKATDESLSYAGLYSFLYKSKDTTRYTNPTFKINIKQVGIEAERECFFDGTNVKELKNPWTANIDWNIGDDTTKNHEDNAPYFVYRGDYYYPVLSADYSNPVTGEQLEKDYETLGGLEKYIRPRLTENVFYKDDKYIRVVDPETPGDCLFVREKQFSGYVLQFRYSNQYFGMPDGHKRDVHFGAHDGGGVEYKTLHKKPGSNVAEGQYVDGVKHAGTYLVTFIASSNGLANDTGVYFASNNFAFNAEVRLKVESATAEVALTEQARNDLGYSGAEYQDRQIADFDNKSDTKIIPVNDNAVIFRYFLFDDEAIWTGDIPKLDDLKQDILDTKFKLVGEVTAQNYKEDGTPNEIPGTLVKPLNARTYIVVVTLELDMNYEEYDYKFEKDDAHLVSIDVAEEKQANVWAYWFTIDPAEVDPYEIVNADTRPTGDTSVTLGTNGSAKSVYYQNVSYAYEYTYNAEDGSKTFEKARFATTANLPTIKFNSTELELGTDYTVEYVDFDETQADGKFNFVDASVGLDSSSSAPEVDGFKFGDYNLAVKITFGGTNHNYINTPETTGEPDGKGTAYEDKDGAFYIYFRIIPVIVTASANISYTYDGGSYDRGRYLPPRVGKGEDDAWYESIFFLAQDSITTSQELIENQKQNIDTWKSADKSRTLKDLWGGLHDKRPEATGDSNTYTDKEFYQQRYYISNVNVQYTNNDFIANGIKLGVGMYSFQTNSPNYQVASYHLTTIDFDGKQSIEEKPESSGVMWLLTVGNTQSFVSTQQDKTAATNFIMSAASYLDVNITQKDITAGDVKVTLNGEDYDSKAIQEYPYSGHEYRPTVTLSYTVQVPTQAAGAHATKSVTINTISIKSDGEVDADKDYDSFITYSNNVQTSTDVLPASVMITAAKTEISKSEFSQNFYNSRTLNFKIVPAHIKVTIVGDHIFTYDRKEHPVTLNYANTTNYSTYMSLMEGATDFVAPVPLEQTEINIMYGEVGADNKVPEGDGGRLDFVSTAPTNAGRYRVAVHLNSTNFIYVAADYPKNTDGNWFVMDSVDGSKDILTYHDLDTEGGKDTDIIINPAVAYIGPGAEAVTEGHEIVNQFTYNRNIQVPSVLSTNICNVSLAGEKWNPNWESSVVPASSSGDYTVTYTNVVMPDSTSEYLKDGFADAGTYWMILDLTSDNFIWGGYEKDDPLFTHEELSNTRLAVKYTISPSEVLLKPNESIIGAIYPETDGVADGTLHFTYDGVKHEVGVNVSSTTLPPLSTEYQLNKVEFVGGAPSFVEKQEDNYLSIYAGTYSFTVTFTAAAKQNYKWSSDDAAWKNYNKDHENSVIVDEAGTGSNTGNKIVYVNGANNTVTITYTIDPATVEIDSITPEQYNRSIHDVPTVTFTNIGVAGVVPTSFEYTKYGISDKQWLFENHDTTLPDTTEQKNNASLGKKDGEPDGKDYPFNAGNYDATITLTGDDAVNFRIRQRESYNNYVGDESKKVTYENADTQAIFAVALFEIQQLGVYANQEVSTNIFDNKDHFNGNPYGLTSGGLYGGNGPWTIGFSSSSGMIQLDGISYNIYFEGKANDGNWYIVKVKIGGYQADATTLNEDKFYLQKLSGEEDDGTSGKAEVSSFGKISALGFFTNAAEYTYKLYFQDANLFISAIEGATAEKEFTYTITAATIALGTLANKTFNNHEQEPDFNDDSFTAVGDTTFEAGTTIFDILDGYNKVKPNSGYTVSYAADAGNARLVGDKPFNAGSYTVTVTLASKNFTFSGSETSTMTFTIDPFDISSLSEDQFKVTLPDVIYTGTAMNTDISRVEVKIEGETVTLVSSGATDGQLQLGENCYDFNISSYDNNVNVSLDQSKAPLKAAIAHIAGSGNFTGELKRNFAILPRPVTVTVYGQSGVYGAGQHLSIGATENTHWSAEQGEIGKVEKKGVVNNDSLGIKIAIVYDSLNTSSQLNVGWYSVRVSYTNANYKVTFKGDNNSLSSYDGYEANAEEEPQTASEGISGDEVAAYDIVNSYYVYKRVISLYVSAQSVNYNGQAPAIQQDNPTYWNVVSVVNGEGRALVSGDEGAFNAAVELYVVAPEEGNDMYNVWKKWGMWSAGSYSDNSGIKARFKEAGADATILQNYEIQGATCAILRIAPAEITVTHNEQSSTYNNDAPTISQTRDSYEITGNTFNSRRWSGNAFDEEPIPNDNAENNLLKFKFTYDDGDSKPTEDYGAGRHLIQGAWDGDPNPNFNVTFNAGVYTINKRDLVITIMDQYAIYGETLWAGEDDGWWLEVSDDHGEKTINPKYWTVEVTNYNKDYPGGDKIYWVNEDDRNALGIKPVIEAQKGANAGTYAISGSWNSSNDDYNVTFVGSWNATNPEKTNGTGGTYTIHQRAIIVHINDQGGVYGGNSFGTAVDQSQGTAESGGWYVVGFDATAQESICGEHTCPAPDSSKPVVVASDNLNIVLTLGDVSAPGEYDIKGECRNNNYAVTWQGSRKDGDVEVGKFAITKRKVTVTIQNQSIAYGQLKNGNTTGFLTGTTPEGNASGYSASATNDSVNPNAFVKDDNVSVELSVVVIHEGYTGGYNQAGRYAIIVKIYEGGKEGKLIYSSLQSEQGSLTTSDKYELTVEGEYTDKDFEAGYKNNDTVFGKTGAYDVTKRDLVVTVADKSSIYGENLEELTFTTNGAMEDEQTEIEKNIHLAIADQKYNDWDEAKTYLCAGSYNIAATLNDPTINNNYNIVFRTQNGADYKTDVEGEKITAMYTVSQRSLNVGIVRLIQTYGNERTQFDGTLSAIGKLTGDLILKGDGNLELAFKIVGDDKEAAAFNFSTSRNLKAGIYPIVCTWNNDPNYTIYVTGAWNSTDTDLWLAQAEENKTLYRTEEEAHSELDGFAGVYEVEKRRLTVTLGTNDPSSEYGDDILDFADGVNTNNSWGVEYEPQSASRGLIPTDNIVFKMTTIAGKGSHRATYPITVVEGSAVGGDNANYNITFDQETHKYTVKPRLLTATLEAIDGKNATDTYGEKYVQENKFKYDFIRTNKKDGDEKLYGEDKIELVITPIESSIYTKTATGYYPVGTYMLNITANNNNDYEFTSMTGTSVRYHVVERPITIYINEQESVFGETITVNQGQGAGLGYGWHVVPMDEYGTIIEGNGKVDDLGITITKDTGDRWTEKGYMLSARATNGNYAITWQGNWEDNNHGTYTIKKRLLLIRIHNQYSIYGESVRVSSETSAWEVVDPTTVGGDVKYYTLLDGQTPDITLNIYTTDEGDGKIWYTRDASTEFSGTIGRGEYHIGVQSIGNPDYDIKVEEDYLPDVNDKSQEQKRKELITKFPDDFGETTTLKTIEVKNPVISDMLANSKNATYFVTIRPVTIKIHDQSGTYGDYLTLNSSGEGASPAYTVDLGKYKGSYVTTGQPFVGGYKATFDLVTTAIEGSDTSGSSPIGKTMGWSLNAGTYPIFGAAYHVFMNDAPIEDESDEAARLSHNYQFNFEGSYDIDDKYPSGTTFQNRAGVYTVDKRQVSLTAKDSSATYGGTGDGFIPIPTPDNGNYQAIVSNSKVNTDGFETRGAILAVDVDSLAINIAIQYNKANLSHAKALKVGKYTLKLTFTENKNYEITAIDGNFEVTVRQASILIAQSAAKATYLATIPKGWSETDADMYTLSNVLSGDIIAFTMTTEAERGNSVGQYKLSGEIGTAGEGNDNANYSVTFTDGTFEITKKQVVVKINDQRSEYGETVNVTNADRWVLSEGWNKDGDFTKNDRPEDLGITLSTTADERTDVGEYQISGQYDISSDVGKNYDLQFVGSWNSSNPEKTNGDGGTLEIYKRRIVVVIKPQAITYRDNMAVDQYAWYAWRDNKTATWTEGHDDTVDKDGVLGPKDKLDALRVYLTKGNATDTAKYGYNTGSGTYVGTYAIVGSHNATNYDITFAYEREEKEAFNYATVKNNEDGTFDIKPYEITINILNLGNDSVVRYGGTDYVKNGGKLYFGAELVNDMGTIWSYADESKTFLPNELGYLSFRLGGNFSSETYAFVGQHPIVGYWGYGLSDKNASDYRMQFNYKVTFTGNWSEYLNTGNREYGYEALYENSGETKDNTCGIIKISNAEVGQASYDQSYEEGKTNGNWHGDNWNRETAFSGNQPQNPMHSMAVGEDDLSFAGNVTFGGSSVSFNNHTNSKLKEAVEVTYSNLKHDGASQVWENAGKAPELQEVGKWTVDVTVEAPYHNVQTFTLTLTITRINITIYLNNKEISIPYGQFKLDGDIVTTAEHDGVSLNDLLKSLLFKTYKENEYLENIVSAGTDETSNVEDIVAYLLDSSDVQVSISTRPNDASSGGFLISQNYVLTISAGENMNIRFGSNYNNVHVTQRALSATWTPNKGYTQGVKDGKTEYVYKFEHKDISVIPRVAEGGILGGDKVLINDNDGSEFSFIIYKLNNNGGGEIPITGSVMRDVGTYRIVILNNITPTPDKNDDIGNYTTPVGEYVYVTITPAEITIVIKDQSSEYGDPVDLKQDDDWWYIKTNDPVQNLPDGQHPDRIPQTDEPLSSLGISLSFEEGVTPFYHGTYAIYGKAATTNYNVVFEGSYNGTEKGTVYDGGAQGSYTITQRNVLVKVKSFEFVYGTDISENLADDSNQYQLVHIVDGAERPGEIAVLPRDMDSINFSITVKNPQTTETEYLKVGEYDVDYAWGNDNYEVKFADEKGYPEGSAFYHVKVNVSKAQLTVTIHGRQVKYGDVRPAMPENYNITGLASRDKDYYTDEGYDRPTFIEFVLHDAETAEPLKDFDTSLDDKYKFDPVGVYIIIGTCVEVDDIGSNYDVEFAGEWTAMGKYTTDVYVGKAGKYEVVPRTLSIVIGSVQSEYGDIIPDKDIPFTRVAGPGNALAGDDTDEALNVTFVTEAIIQSEGGKLRTNNVGTYPITKAISGNKNYVIDGYIPGTYKIVPREITIVAFDMTHPYGDYHLAYLDAAALNNGWTAHRFGEGKVGDGIAYPDTDAIVGQVKLTVNGLSDKSAVNDYALSYTQNGSDVNYIIKDKIDATYHVVPRKVMLTLKDQTSEYGERHAVSSGEEYFEFTLLEKGSNRTEAVVFGKEDKVISTLALHFVDAINEFTAAGDYRIDASFTDSNYEVTIAGDYSDGERQYGKYIVTKRDIVIKLLGTQQSEYGDPVFASSDETKGWIADRPEGKGGSAFVNGDKFELELTVLDSLGRAVDSTYSVGKYAVIVKQVISKEVSVNYNITYAAQDGQAFEGSVSEHADEAAAVYNIVPRKITVKFGGESEYGDPIKVNDMSYRTGGKEGPAIVNGDNLGYAFEWGAQGDPTNGGSKLADVGQYALKLKTATDADAQKVCANYDITPDENSFYHVVPRKITVHVGDITKTYGDEFEDPDNIREALLEVSRTTAGATGNAILNNDIQFFRLSVINGDNILLTDGRPVHAGVYNYRLTYTDNNRNYEIIVDYGHYTIVPKPITVTIDSKTSKYSEDIVELTHGEVKGLIGEDDLYITLSVLWLDEEQGLEWHNAGVYAIQGVYVNPDYAVTFKGDMGAYGKYTIEKAENRFVNEYNGNGTVYMGDNFRDGDLPTALWGNDSLHLEFYLDEEMTHKADFNDIFDATAGTYYVKVIVDESLNWKGAITSFTLNIVDALAFSDGMDVTAYVCVFMTQFIILACALIFIKRKKAKKNKKI